MTVLKWLSICLTLFCQGTAASKPCDWTQYRLRSMNDHSIRLLSEMGGYIPHMCSEEKDKQMFPEDVYMNTQVEDVSVVALEAMGYVAQIFNKSLTSVTWNKIALNQFQNIIYRQVEKLKLCVAGGVGASSGDGGSVTASNASLKTYFDKLKTVLKEKEHSTCAWEIVREEVRKNLVQFKKFIDSKVKP